MRRAHQQRAPFVGWLAVAAALLFLGTGALIGYQRSAALRRAMKIISYRWRAPTPAENRGLAVFLDVPYHRQEHALSCEVAALKMALDYYGVDASESALIARLPFATRQPRSRDNTWGDPDLGFVGDIDGVSPNSGYGVYGAPLVALAQQSGIRARIMPTPGLSDILNQVSQRHPVIVWGTLASGRDISWVTPEGKRVKAIVGEHTRVVIGFSGPVEAPTAILLHDPIYGTITMAKETFEANWATLGNRAVVIEGREVK